MKPNWDDAPEWANFLAMDSDGDWWWYEDRPVKLESEHRWEMANAIGDAEPARIRVDGSDWGNTLERRP